MARKHVRVMVLQTGYDPDLPGKETCTAWSGKRRGVTKDGIYWEIKPDGLFQRWRWRPHSGEHVTIREVA